MINLGLVGTGIWGKNYIVTISRLTTCRLTYICAKTVSTLPAFAGSFKKTTRYQDLLPDKNLDGVIITTPASTHFKIAGDFITRGIPVLVEKPVVTSYSQALLFKKFADISSSVIMAGHIYKYHPAFNKLIELSKTVGSIRYVVSEGCDLGPVRSDVTALWDWLPHDVSMCLQLFTREPQQVSAWGITSGKGFKDKQSPIVFIRLIFTPGIPVFIKIGWLSPIKKRNFTVVGTNEAVIFDDTDSRKVKHITYPTMTNEMGIKPGRDKIRIHYPVYNDRLPLEREITEFLKRIKSRKAVKDTSEIVSVTRICQAAEKSLVSGETVTLI